MAKINMEKEDIKRYVNEANRRLGNNSVFHAVNIEKKEDQNYYLICKNGKHTISIRINSSSSMKKESTFCRHLYKKMEKEIEKLNKQKMNEFKYEFLELYTKDINKKLQKETTGSLQIENDCIILKSTKYNTKKSYHFFSTINFDDFLSIKQTKLSPSIFYILHISLKQKKYDQIIDTFSNVILKKMQTVPFTINSEYAIDLIPYAEELFEQRNNVFVRAFIGAIHPNRNYQILANNYKCNCIQLKNNMLSITKNEDRFVLNDCLMKTQLELIETKEMQMAIKYLQDWISTFNLTLVDVHGLGLMKGLTSLEVSHENMEENFFINMDYPLNDKPIYSWFREVRIEIFHAYEAKKNKLERFLKKQKEQKEQIAQSYLLQDILHITETKHPTYYMITNLVQSDFPLYTIEEILEIIDELKEYKIVEYYNAGRVLEKIEEYTLTENEIELAFEKFEKNKPLTDIEMWKVFERKNGTKCSIQDYLKLFAFADNRSFICEKREKFVKWLRDNMPIEAKQLLIMKRDVEEREYVREIIDEITAPDE